MKKFSECEKFRSKFEDPESKFNEKELLLIEKDYLFKNYNLVYDCLFKIHLSLRDFNVTFEEERFETYEDFGINHWIKSKEFAVDLLSCGKANVSQIIEFISEWIGISKKNLMTDLRFNSLLENTIRLLNETYFFTAHNHLQEEIRGLIIKRIETITYSYLEMVDVFNFIDYLNVGFMGRLNEYDFYPIKVWRKIEMLESKDKIKDLLEEIFIKMGSIDLKDQNSVIKDSFFINILPENEELMSRQIGTNLNQRIEIGAKMILKIMEKYPLLKSYRYY